MSKISQTLKVVSGVAFAFALVIGSSVNAAITSQLKQGSRNSQVLELQQFLNNCSAETMVAASGAGSKGMETSYFGPATKRAVIAFQTKMGITTTSYSAGLVGPATRAAITAGCGTSSNPSNPSNPVSNGPVSAMLATNNPASSVFVVGQATADLAHFNFAGSGTVTSVTLQRVGVSSDSTLNSVYLFDGITRITDSASVTNNGMITFNNAAGLFTVNGSKVISVKSDIWSSASSGQTVAVKLVSFTTTGATGATMSGVTGNYHTIASATLAGVSAGTVSPSGATINPAAAQTLWQTTLNVTQRDVWMKRLALRQVGSAPASSMQNFKLYVNGAQVGSTVASLDAMGYVTFDMTSSPVMLASGSRILRVDADVVSGASRTIQLSLRQAADVDFVDSSYGVNITPTSTPWVASTALTIGGTSGGTMIVSKDTTLSSSDVTNNGTDVAIGRFSYQAFGEAIKLETITASFTGSDGSTASLRNGRVLINGVQYGSTATLNKTSAGGTAFSVNYIVMPGTTATVEIHADMYDNDGTNDVSANDTIMGNIVAGSSNAVRQDSLGYTSVPGSAVAGQTMTVKTASATLLKNGSYTNQTVNIPQTAYKLGSWNLSAGSTEDLTVNTLSVDITSVTNATFSAADLTNVWFKFIRADGTSVVTNPLATVSDTANTFSLTTNLPKGTSGTIEMYANILSGNITAADSVKTTLTVTGTSAVSGTSVSTSAVDGQTTTYNTGSLSISESGSPVNRAVSGNQEVIAGQFKFIATNDSFTVNEIDVSVGSATIASAVSTVKLYDGATLVGTKSFTGDDADSGTGNMASFTSLGWTVAAGNTKYLTVNFILNSIGASAGSSQQNASVQLDRVKYQDSTGSLTTYSTDVTTNELYVYKAVPTLAQSSVDTTTKLVNGSQRDLFKFTITAPSSSVSPNGVTVKQVRLPVTWNDGGAAGDALEIESMKVLVDGSDITSSDVTVQDQAGNTAESTSGLTEADSYAVISWDAGKELTIPAGSSRIITVRGVPQGFNVIDATTTPTDSVGFNLLADAAHNSTKIYLNGISGIATIWGLHTSAAATGSGTVYNFIWSDTSANPHVTAENASSSSDWANGYKIFNDMAISQFND